MFVPVLCHRVRNLRGRVWHHTCPQLTVPFAPGGKKGVPVDTNDYAHMDGCVIFRHRSFKRRLKEQRTETKTAGKGGVFRLDRNHMKAALEEELGLNLTV